MNKTGKWTEEVKVVRDNLKGIDFVTKDGEVVELHDSVLDSLAMDTVNMSEQLSGNGVTDKQKEILKMKNEQDAFQKRILETYGSFYFSFYKRIKLGGQFLFRFIHLCSYMNYDNYLSNGIRLLREDDLMDLMMLNKSEYHKTKNFLIDNDLISITENNLVIVNPKFCKKGEIHRNRNIEVIRVFNESIQELYNKSLPREHKRLALLIEILPYINYKYNIVCSNPEESSIELIKPIKMSDLCEMLGYDRTNSSRLKKQLFSLRVSSEKVIGMFEVEDSKAILVNPRVYYKGNKEDDLDYLEALFRL